MGNINRMVDIVVLLILTGLSVSDIRNKKVSRKVLTLWGLLTVFWKIVDFYQIRVFLEKMEQTNVGDLAGICAGIGVGVLFLLVSKVTEEAIGYGDSVAIMILGGYLGFWKVVGVLAAAFFTSGVCSVILAFRGRVKTMPFFPFLTLGYILMLAEQAADVQTILKQYGFSQVTFGTMKGTASENLIRIQGEKDVLREEYEKAAKEAAAKSARKADIEAYADMLTIAADKEKIKTKLLKTKRTFFLEGWIPQKCAKKAAELLDDYECYYAFREPEAEEEVPVLLENRSFFRPTEAITEMYSLPSYWGFDPTSIYALFYIVFFGMMFSDAGYGLLMAIGCFIILKKFDLEGTTWKMIRLFFYCGISTFVWGALFGGWFGDVVTVFSSTFLGKAAELKPLWFNPLDDPMKLLILSLILGVIHLFIGMGIQAYMEIKDGRWMDAICGEGVWYLTILGLAALLGGSTQGIGALGAAGKWMSIIGAAGVLIAGARGKKGIGMLTGAFANLYNITSWLSDILSYARLLALGLATGVIAQVVNTMGSLFGGGVAGLVLFILIFAVGHTINFAINMLGAFIHAARLQYVEFFGKFYVDGGEPFDPFRRKTKYIRFENEE